MYHNIKYIIWLGKELSTVAGCVISRARHVPDDAQQIARGGGQWFKEPRPYDVNDLCCNCRKRRTSRQWLGYLTPTHHVKILIRRTSCHAIGFLHDGRTQTSWWCIFRWTWLQSTGGQYLGGYIATCIETLCNIIGSRWWCIWRVHQAGEIRPLR